jgi:hypothetical protein
LGSEFVARVAPVTEPTHASIDVTECTNARIHRARIGIAAQ